MTAAVLAKALKMEPNSCKSSIRLEGVGNTCAHRYPGDPKVQYMCRVRQQGRNSTLSESRHLNGDYVNLVPPAWCSVRQGD